MTNDTGEFKEGTNSSEGNMPLNDNPTTPHQVKDYGKKSLGPLIDLVHRYQDDINPYLNALSKGLEAAAGTLNQSESSEAERMIGNWFSEADNWFKGVQEKIKSTNKKDFMNFLEEEARLRPGIMFSSSYVAGLILGRMGKHMNRLRATKTSDTIH